MARGWPRSLRARSATAVLGIVRSHGGTILLRDRPGGGTCFPLLLPASSRALPVRPPASAEPPSDWHGGRAVLVVDDEADVRDVAAAMLEAAGVPVRVVDGGPKAIREVQARGDSLCAVLLDLTMPEMSGGETCRELRRTQPDLPIGSRASSLRTPPPWASPTPAHSSRSPTPCRRCWRPCAPAWRGRGQAMTIDRSKYRASPVRWW